MCPRTISGKELSATSDKFEIRSHLRLKLAAAFDLLSDQ